MFFGATHRDVGSRLKTLPTPRKGGRRPRRERISLGCANMGLEGTIHQNALAFWIATLNLYPLLVSLISVHPPPSLTNPGFITWGSVHRPLYLRFGLAALRRFFVRFSSNLRPEGLLMGVRSNQGRISDGTWFRNRRRLRTARWALACLPMRSPSSSFWLCKDSTFFSFIKAFGAIFSPFW